jgi:drug/metabolite transporter (DMT)-like permease
MPRRPLAQRLSPPVFAVLLSLGASLCFAVMNGIIRYLGADLHVDPLEIVFFRNLFAFLAMTPWLARQGIAVMRTDKLPLLGVRVFWGFISMVAWFSSLAIMPLANAMALSFTAPLFAAVAAVLMLGEVIRARRVVALAIGFAGMLVILRPGHAQVGWGELLVIVSAATMALSIVTMKKLTRSERPACLVAWQSLLLTPVSLVPALFVWRWPSVQDLLWLIAVGAIGSVAHLLYTRAFSLADTTFLMPIDYVRLPCVALIGWVAFGETTDLWTWIGAAVIAASTVYIARREALARSREAEQPALASARPQPAAGDG